MSIRDYPLNFLGGDTWEQDIDGDFFRITEAAGPVFVSLDSGPFGKREVGQAQRTKYGQLRIKSIIAQTVRISAGSGDLTDNRQDVTVNVETGLDPGNNLLNAGDVTILAGVSGIVAAGNANRKGIIIQASYTNDPEIVARIGNAAVNAISGIELAAGVGLPEIETTAAIYCFNPGATPIKVCYVENEKL